MPIDRQKVAQFTDLDAFLDPYSGPFSREMHLGRFLFHAHTLLPMRRMQTVQNSEAR